LHKDFVVYLPKSETELAVVTAIKIRDSLMFLEITEILGILKKIKFFLAL
jgi:hypothetical protein